jgi:hypothetical protein
MTNVPPLLPTLTVNRSFMREFIAADPPCFALGMVEERKRQYGFLALRPDQAIPAAVANRGFKFGHALLGNAAFEVIQFAFEFYGFQTYNVLVNPNNLLVQAVLAHMIEGGDYFFFALNPNDSVTAFRAAIGQETLTGLKANLARIQHSATTERQYRQALAQFAANPEPPGILLQWICRDNIDYLDLTTDRMALTPT